MNFEAVKKIADAVLYEGYALYPYRATAVKNRQRFNFGGLYPPAYSQSQFGNDACEIETECLALAGPRAALEVHVRLLQLVSREVERLRPGAEGAAWQQVEAVEINGRLVQSWQEAIERDVTTSAIVLEEVAAAPLRCRFAFDAACEIEPLHDGDGKLAARVCRRREGICGSVEISAQRVADGAYRVRALISNDTPLANVALLRRDDVLLRTCVSTHAILGLEGGEFVSLLEPPEPYRELAAGCRNSGVWPVLAGREGDRTMVLASPIILYDHPAIAPESAGDLFDGAEIDELLTLRILSLTDDEKRHMRSLDDRTREILERTEMLPQEQMEKLHGAIRGLRPLHEAIE